jgi:protein-export membrane protein SecD
MTKRSPLRTVLVCVTAVVILLIALPQEGKRFLNLQSNAWYTKPFQWLYQPSLHLGLDLAGGTQLDFRISEEEINQQLAKVTQDLKDAQEKNAPSTDIANLQAQKASIEQQRDNLVEAVRTVLERRINALGVSEATITPSYVGNEKHLLVECPGVVDVQKCIATVGKTIKLEFKEEFNTPTAEFTAGVRKNASETYARLVSKKSTLVKEGQDLGSQLGTTFTDRITFFRDELPKGLEGAWTAAPGTVYQADAIVPVPTQDANGQLTMTDMPGIFLYEVLQGPTMSGRTIADVSKAMQFLSKNSPDVIYTTQEKYVLSDTPTDKNLVETIKAAKLGDMKVVEGNGETRLVYLRETNAGGDQVAASHILVSFKGATGADASITRTKEEALARANDLRKQILAGRDFVTTARRESDGPSKKDGGRLGTFGRGVMAPTFEAAAFALQKTGDLSAPVETQFGYHIIRLDTPVTKLPATANFDLLTFKGEQSKTKAESALRQMQDGKVKTEELAIGIRTLFFSLTPTGWKDTALDGKHFRHASVSLDPTTGVPVVQIAFDDEGARLFQALTKANINKQIAIFVGGELVSAPRVQQEIAGGNAVITGSKNIAEARNLSQDLNTGAIPAPIHLTGQYTVEATLGATAMQTAFAAGAIGLVLLMIYMAVVYRLLGLIANLALTMYIVILFAIIKLPLFLVTNNYVVLTLAGMAGIILSAGLAVDANVLVFERMKEELRRGRTLRNSVDSSFKHAWPAVRDGNISTLITCAILFLVGTSIVRGFAVTLSIGTLLSMFTAFVVSRWILNSISHRPEFQDPRLCGVKPVHHAPHA